MSDVTVVRTLPFTSSSAFLRPALLFVANGKRDIFLFVIHKALYSHMLSPLKVNNPRVLLTFLKR